MSSAGVDEKKCSWTLSGVTQASICYKFTRMTTLQPCAPTEQAKERKECHVYSKTKTRLHTTTPSVHHYGGKWRRINAWTMMKIENKCPIHKRQGKKKKKKKGNRVTSWWLLEYIVLMSDFPLTCQHTYRSCIPRLILFLFYHFCQNIVVCIWKLLLCEYDGFFFVLVA